MRQFTNATLNLIWVFAWIFWNFQTKLAEQREIKHHMACDCAPFVPNLRSFEQMLCEVMVQEYLIGVEGHDRLTPYLNYESGLVR